MSQQRVDLQQLKEQKEQLDCRLPQMEAQIHDVNQVVERLTKEVTQEAKRRQDLAVAKEQLVKQNILLRQQFEKLQITDVDEFKDSFDSMKRDVIKLKKQLSDKTTIVKSKEQELKQREKEVHAQY